MTPNLVLVLTCAVLVGTGVYLLLARSVTRALFGLILLSNGVNVLFLVAAGPAGGAPILGVTPIAAMSDPLPQAMVLTAIVITLGLTAFLLAIAHRSWQLSSTDQVEDDVEDVRLLHLAESPEALLQVSREPADEVAP